MEEIFYYSLFVFHSILQSQTNLNGICVCVKVSVNLLFSSLAPSLSLGASLVSGKLWRPEKNITALNKTPFTIFYSCDKFYQ